ncbi:3'(2'),5'-bisphosphate nucleotidase CysQ [Amylibacter sp. SFDW26]|uniref:3'(2'),5'-bisphosphate nucleotidase CysQ n=1 Tax=Amylibacter sp. SFDW26 TaxID=2652722 RepID=UPI001261A47A|nr:3'(2'),5'-bisphosphate nucleotidase CysQ [Amylibacter sp. SFDW26]KAB7614463.1 3'(2'),5'-bisphosphate nucleotidase CysQ [Amylibacter sp. SFDW26]
MQGHDLTLLLDAAKAAGDIALKYFQSDVDTWDKGGGQGPVTQADIEIDQMLHAELLGARSDYGWLSEETEDNTERLDRDVAFIVDPIDGTKSFINGHENFATSIAIAEKGVVRDAVVHCPVKQLTYWASAGQGAFLNGEAIAHNGANAVRSARILAAGSQMKLGYWKDQPPPIERHFRSSLAYRLCLVAQGRFDGMMTLRDTWEWDVAAGDLICREAGAKVSDRGAKVPIYNQSRPLLAGMIAAAPELHDGLIPYLK